MNIVDIFECAKYDYCSGNGLCVTDRDNGSPARCLCKDATYSIPNCSVLKYSEKNTFSATQMPSSFTISVPVECTLNEYEPWMWFIAGGLIIPLMLYIILSLFELCRKMHRSFRHNRKRSTFSDATKLRESGSVDEEK